MTFLDNILDFDGRKVDRVIKEKNPYTDNFFDKREEELKTRVSTDRYNHTIGVVEMATLLAEVYDVDVEKARLAALLHDWDKCYDKDEMQQRIKETGVDKQVDKKIIKRMPNVLHGLTAAFALAVEYPQIPVDVLQAVANHTTAAMHMSALDMVIFIADALDPGRKYPEYEELVDMIGKISLTDLFVKVYAQSIIAVILKRKPMYPKTTEIWNRHINKYIRRHRIE